MFLHFEQEHFFQAFMWLTISSPLIFFKNSFISTERLKNIFAYLQLINFVVWTNANGQLRYIITLEHFMTESTLEMSLGSSHVKLSLSSRHEWCHNGNFELENKVLSKWENFVKEI